MITPQRVQRSRQRKLESPNGLPVVCVDRSTCWGNPYKVGDLVDYETISQEKAVALFAAAIAVNNPALKFRKADLWKLRGKNLACWCQKNQPCHADVLLTLANKETENENQQTPFTL